MTLKDRILLITGILLILLSLFLRWVSDVTLLFWLLLFLGIVLKSIFLYRSLRAGRLHWNLTLKILLTGVALVLLSIGLRTINSNWMISNVLLYSGILLKLLFVAIMIINKAKTKKREKSGLLNS